MSAPNESNLTATLKIELTADNYSVTGLDWDDLITIASESPLFRTYLQSLTRSLARHHNKHVDVVGLLGHLNRMDAREPDAPIAAEIWEAAKREVLPELIEMIKLQDQLNTAYANLIVAHAGGWRK